MRDSEFAHGTLHGRFPTILAKSLERSVGGSIPGRVRSGAELSEGGGPGPSRRCQQVDLLQLCSGPEH
jgi:hypothetical protein